MASEVLDALRGRHPTAIVKNVYGTEKDYSDELERTHREGATFRVLGAYRGSVWGLSDVAVLVFSTFFSSHSDMQPKAYSVTLREPDFEALRSRLKVKGLACGEEHFYLTQKKPHPLRAYSCPLCELLEGIHRPFLYSPEGFRRNSRYITEVQAEVALELGKAATVREVAEVFSRN